MFSREDLTIIVDKNAIPNSLEKIEKEIRDLKSERDLVDANLFAILIDNDMYYDTQIGIYGSGTLAKRNRLLAKDVVQNVVEIT